MRGEGKIRPVQQLVEVAASLRAEGKRIVHCHGVFDLLHIGAIRHLSQVRKLGDLLVVTVIPDEAFGEGGLRPLLTQDLRAEAVAALADVDYVGLAGTPSMLDAIAAIHPDTYVPSWDDAAAADQNDDIARQLDDAVRRAGGGRVVRLEEAKDKSFGLTHRYSPALSKESVAWLDRFFSRYRPEAVTTHLENARNLRVLFLGEAIIDEYQYCETMGKSGKEPVLAVRYVSSEKFAGGILATANQAAVFSDHVGMLTLLGCKDSHENFIREKLDPKIDASFIYMPGSPTIVKRRLVELYPFQKMFEIYVMDQEVSEAVSAAVYARLKSLLPHYDAVVVVDYGHGMITPEIVEFLCGQKCFLAVNTQTNAANQGYHAVSKYRRADYVCISEKELRMEARSRSKDLRLMTEQIAEKLCCPRMLITRGQQGCLCYEKGEGFWEIPSFTNRIVDRIGAGDALLAVTALCAARGTPMEVVGCIGNATGGAGGRNRRQPERGHPSRAVAASQLAAKLRPLDFHAMNASPAHPSPAHPSPAAPLRKVLVTGGAGYVGSALVPKLLAAGHQVKVLDLYLFGDHVLDAVKNHPALEQIKGDLRDSAVVKSAVAGCDAVIHLACISNDPSFELNPQLGKSINYDAFFPLVDLSKDAGIRRFIYASSSSVYGVKAAPNVTEELPLEPLTDYSKYKAMCEDVLLAKRAPGFTVLILRPATVCGYSPRLRLDLTVNILTNHAVTNRQIKVFGGTQMRPNIHIDDMAEAYLRSLQWPDEQIDGRIYNVGYENYRLSEIAEMARKVVGPDVNIVTTPTDDLRSYHVSSEKIKRELGFAARHSVEDAVRDLVSAFGAGKIPDSMTDVRYYNIKTMQSRDLA